jgi:hypothetical protein
MAAQTAMKTVKACQHDEQRTLADFENEAKNNSAFLAATTVPKDLEIDAHKVRFAIENPTSDYAFPDPASREFAGFRPGYRDLAACRVKDLHGIWWFAYRGKHGALSYISSAFATEETRYDRQIRAENYERLQKRRLEKQPTQ